MPNIDPKASEIILSIESIVTTLGIIIAGVWAYFQYFRGRIYKPRLELVISVQHLVDNKSKYLLIEMTLKNVGLSKVNIKQKGTALSILEYEPKGDWSFISNVDTTDPSVFSIFEHHQWLESGETIQENRLFALPEKSAFAYKVEMRIIANKTSWLVSKVVPFTE